MQKKYLGELSDGMREPRRPGTCSGLEPEISMYDDAPTAGLDPLATRNVDVTILQTCDRYKVTSVVSSHGIAAMVCIAERIAMHPVERRGGGRTR